MAINTRKYIEEFVNIRDKDAHIVPFKLNQAQEMLYDVIRTQHTANKPIRIIILKARQLGFSTFTAGFILKNTATKSNINSGIIAHKEDSSTNIFNMYKLMYDNLPDAVRPTQRASNAKELIFDNAAHKGLNSRIRCMTAGAKGVGRSFTMNYLHLSELAFWEGDVKATLLGLFQAVPNKPDTAIIIESTANGYETFKELWDAAVAGDNDFYPLFVGWNQLKEYSIEFKTEKDKLEFIASLTKEEKKLQSDYELTYEQLNWRRWCIKNNCGGSIDQFHQEYPITPDEAFLATGSCVFNQENILKRLEYLSHNNPVIDRGEFNFKYDGLRIKNPVFVSEERGPVRIFKMPERGHNYVIGADTAGEGSDYFYAHVVDNDTGIEVAMYREDHVDETVFAHTMYSLGMFYNEALIAPESNFSTYPIKELERLQYPHIFVRQKEDNYTHGVVEAYGFRTTQITRPIVIALVQDVIRDAPELINDVILLKECLTFVKNERGRAEAMEGKHDDGVMSYGITLYARGQGTFNPLVEAIKPKKLFKWSEDLKQDYYRADAATRERMRERYGEIN